MAPRNLAQLQETLTGKGIAYDLSPLNPIKELMGSEVYEAAALKYLRGLDQAAEEPTRDWSSEFLADAKAAAAITRLRDAITNAAQYVAKAREQGSKLGVSLTLSADRDEAVKLTNKTRATGTRANRNYEDLARKLAEAGIDKLFLRRVKSDNAAYELPIKPVAVSDENQSGFEIFNPISKGWQPFGTLPTIAKAIMGSAMRGGERTSDTVDSWKSVRVANPDTTRGAQSIGDFYDSGADEDDDQE